MAKWRIASNAPPCPGVSVVIFSLDGDFAATLMPSTTPAPDETHRNLAASLQRAGRLEEAAGAYRRLIAGGAAGARDHHALALIYAQTRQFERAIEQFGMALALDPNHAAAQCNLGLTLEDLGRTTEAIAALRAARRVAGDLPLIMYHLAALGDIPAPRACPPDYLVQLFDGYAGRFDAHLVAKLGYRGPQLLLDSLVPLLAPDAALDVIDLGCGTGLCGALFRPRARSLVGVDLSPLMLEQSRRRGVYDELVKSDLAPALLARPGGADVLLAADVFIYVGDLAPIFYAAATALRAGGFFAFTLEIADCPDFTLCRSRRYAHNPAYIRRLAAETGLVERGFTRAILRAGEEAPVTGAVVVMGRP